MALRLVLFLFKGVGTVIIISKSEIFLYRTEWNKFFGFMSFKSLFSKSDK